MKLSRRLRRAMLVLLATGPLGFAGASGLAAWWLTAAVSHPVGAVPTDFSWPVETVHFPASAGDVTLAGWFVPCAGAKQAVVLLHGYQADRRMMLARAHWLRAQGFAVLLYDARACGESGGSNISAGWLETGDLLGAVDFLRGRGFTEFGCVGVSQGGATIALAAARLEGLRWAVLESVYPTLRNALDRRFRLRVGLPAWLAGVLVVPFAEWRLGADVDAVSPRDGAAGRRCPVLVMSGERDGRTQPADAKEVFDRVPGNKELWIVPGADHEDLHMAARDEYQRRVLGFITAANQTNLKI